MAGNRQPFTVSNNRKDKVNVESDPSLIDAPSDVVRLIGSWLDIKSAGRYVKTGRTINNFFKPNLDKEAEPFAAEALHYAAFGKMEELDELLKKRPGLVYMRGSTLEPCGRTVYGTVYRIALGTKDWSPFPDRFEEMAEMIERHMKTLPKGEEERELQKAEQFPEGWEEQEKEREEKDSAALKEVFAAIGQSKTDEDCVDAIEKFINYLKSQNEVKTGYYFNDKLLSLAHELHDNHYHKFGGFDSRKNRLAAIKIIGGIQGRMTGCLAMAHCDGLGLVAEGRGPLSRKMEVDGTPFFSPSLGSSHFVYSYSARCAALRRGAAAEASAWPFANLCRAKTSSLISRQNSAFKRAEPAKRSSCVIS